MGRDSRIVTSILHLRKTVEVALIRRVNLQAELKNYRFTSLNGVVLAFSVVHRFSLTGKSILTERTAGTVAPTIPFIALTPKRMEILFTQG